MPNNPLVSVVLPTKNRKRFLAESISSVVAQDYAPFELLIVDGAPSDGSTEIIASFPAAKYLLQENEGIADAWNQGIREATGKYIAFMASDDIWTPDKLRKHVNYFNNHPGTLSTISQTKFFIEEGSSAPPGFRPELLDKLDSFFILEALVADRELFAQIGNFDISISSAHDVDWFARLQDSAAPQGVIPEVLLLKRIHDHNVTYNQDPVSANKTMLEAMRKSILRKRGGQV